MQITLGYHGGVIEPASLEQTSDKLSWATWLLERFLPGVGEEKQTTFGKVFTNNERVQEQFTLSLL